MLTIKQEKFVQNIIKGMSQREVYKRWKGKRNIWKEADNKVEESKNKISEEEINEYAKKTKSPKKNNRIGYISIIAF